MSLPGVYTLRRRFISQLQIFLDTNSSPQVWERYRQLDAAFTAFLRALPPLGDLRGMSGGDDSLRPGISPDMLRVRVGTLAAAFFLTGIPGSNDVALHERRVNIAIQGAELANQLSEFDVKLIYPHVIIGVRNLLSTASIRFVLTLIPPTVQTSWYVMAETLIDELLATANAARQNINKQWIRSLREALRVYADRLAMLQGFYTGLSS